MEIHYSKHHATYITNLNNALATINGFSGLEVDALIAQLDKLPDGIRTAVRNNGGGHSNHTHFWRWLQPGGDAKPSPALTSEIAAAFGSVDSLIEQFSQAALTRFGSGWAWLAREASGKLSIYSTPNQDNPLMEGKKPLLGLDVWEHAYYLNYQNRRVDYVKAFWKVVNWSYVSELYKA
jgi:Fe-Mn family superoxide dismutase